MNEVFISYSREDKELAAHLSSKLESKGLSVFWDHKIEIGESWRKVLRRELENAKCIIVIWSNNSLKSNWVMEEAQIGLDRNILVPITIDSVNPPLGFRGIQTAVLDNWKGELSTSEFSTLLAGIQGTLDQSTQQHNQQSSNLTKETESPSKSTRTKKRSLLLIGLVVLILGSVVTLMFWPKTPPDSVIKLDSKESKETRLLTSKSLDKVLEDAMKNIQVAKPNRNILQPLTQEKKTLPVSNEEAANVLQIVHVLENSGDYQGAWRAILSAKTTASDPTQKFINQAWVNLAMNWLENIVVREGEMTFSEIVDITLPVISNGLKDADDSRKSDLLAHIGWAQFLKSRDGANSNPEIAYKDALRSDPNNPYANVFFGHWTLWQHKSLSLAEQYFKTALSSGHARNFVRQLQLAALSNSGGQGDRESALIKVVSEMIQNGETVPPKTKRIISSIYYFSSRKDADIHSLVKRLPAITQLSVIRKLFFEQKYPIVKRRSFAPGIAILFKKSGDQELALHIWNALRSWYHAYLDTRNEERANLHIASLKQ